VFTLPAVTSRIYVVTSPTLAAEVQRKRTLLFDPLVPDVTARVLGLESETINRMRINVDRTEGNWGILPDLHDSNSTSLGLGKLLDELTTRVTGELTTRLNDFGQFKASGGSSIDLLAWTQNIFTQATAVGFYGPLNPLSQQASLHDDFWEFDHGLGSLLIGILPQYTASGPYHARERLVEAFKPYLQNKLYVNASGVVQKRIALLDKHNFSLDSAARSELSFMFAGIINTTVASFWLVLRLFADPDLLNQVRQEISSAHGFDTNSIPSNDKIDLRISVLKNSCPLLNACSRESMRLASDAASTRLVTSETTIFDKDTGKDYTLCAGAILQIAGAAMHADERIWGSDANVFNPYRYLPAARNEIESKGEKRASSTREHPASYRAFGGGSTLCPGRYLAISEVLAWTAAVLMSLDVTDAITVPEKEDGKLPVHLCEPKSDINMKVRWRGTPINVEL
jgi:cytochrome P450